MTDCSTDMGFVFAAARLAEAGRMVEAVDHLLLGRKTFPDSPAILEHLGLCYREIEEWALCRRAIEAARRRRAWSVSGEIARGEALHKLGRETVAVELLESLLNRPDLTPPQLADLARTLGSVGRTASALECCRRILRARPGDADALFGVAVYRHKLGHSAAEVAAAAGRAVAAAPGNLSYRGFLGMMLYLADRRDEARGVLSAIPDAAIRCPTLLGIKQTVCGAMSP